jgi:hypothetical protein
MTSRKKSRGNRGKAVLVMGTVCAGAASAYARKRAQRLIGRKDAYTVLVNRPADELEPEPGRFATPLAELARHARVELHPARSGRGTAVHAEATDSDADVRQELRAAKQVLETGEELRADSRPAHRGPAAQQSAEVLDRILARGGGR